ncbi:phosphate transport system substrate-binding protein [Evansella vedderi]|uniref:Phosphate transport system substrate-binding protein n=1 Tax=Evansella vedderi TaxID=38282 RepID=A0ABT9ZX56_9BACI|nr:substrate-binding domain-containing protein [Evansella vedderi]MDQ0255808.1 phosphate transport system substrate-binding protein [Evansella vedderi]
MNDSIGVKFVYTVFFTGLFLFAGFVAIIYASFTSANRFLIPIIIITALGCILFFILAVFNILSKKPLRISSISFFSICILSFLSIWMYESYQESLVMVEEGEVNLYEYQPFREGTKAVSLEEESTLKIENDLPILDGATALYPVYSAFARAVYPEKDYDPYWEGSSEVLATKTNQAYTNLINGRVDIIFAAGPSNRQLQMAEARGVELELTPIGREAFVFFVNARNPVEGLTIEQIQGIYSGEITNWSEVGGNNEAIRAFQRPDDSGSQTALENLMGDIPLMEAPTEDVVGGMGGIINQTSNYRNHRNAIGYSFRYYSTEMVQNGEIKHLEVEGVFPDKESIRNGQYPIAAEFYVITAGTENPHVEELIEWILSDQGQYIIEKTGYVPIN